MLVLKVTKMTISTQFNSSKSGNLLLDLPRLSFLLQSFNVVVLGQFSCLLCCVKELALQDDGVDWGEEEEEGHQ